MRCVKKKLVIVRFAISANLHSLVLLPLSFFRCPCSAGYPSLWQSCSCLTSTWYASEKISKHVIFFHYITCKKVWHILKKNWRYLKSSVFTWEYWKDSFSDFIEVALDSFRSVMVKVMASKMSLCGELLRKISLLCCKKCKLRMNSECPHMGKH